MCLRRRFKKGINTTVAAGSKELLLDLEEKCCIRQFIIYIDMNDSTGTKNSKLIIKIDEDEILNESIADLVASYGMWSADKYSNRPFQMISYDDSTKIYRFLFLDLGRVERRFAVFFENKDTTNSVYVKTSVIYDILED